MKLNCTKIKKNSIFPALLFMMLALSANMMAQVSVTASAGTMGPTAYTTLNAAFAAVNSGVHQGAIAIAITANTSEPATPTPLLASGGSSSYTSISIKPSGGSFTIASAAAPVTNRGVIELAGADNVTIDGDDPGTPGTQNLSIVVAPVTTAGVACIRLSSNSVTGADGADNNTVKNCIIVGSRSSATSNVTNYGIQFSNGTATSSSTTGAYSSLNTLIQGNTITRCYYGIHAIGNSATYLNTGTKIIKNTIGSATAASYVAFSGIDISYSSTTPGATSALISQNDIRTGHTNGNATMAAVQLGAANAGAIITANNIHDCINPTSSVWGMYGILISSATSNSGITITNNFIRDIAGYPVSSFGNQYGGYGIYVNAAATGLIINHNTIAQLLSTVIGSCIQITDGSATVAQFQNNILVNNVNSPYSCLFYATANGNISGGTVNYNDYYINASGVFGYNGANATTFAAWKTATTKDANSLNVLPSFVSATDLHITPAQITYLESAGTGTASTGVNTDYDNDSRPGPAGSVNGGALAPDMGADEFDGIIPPTPAVINSASVSPGSQCNAVAHTVTANITPGATALTSVYLSYAFNGIAQPTVAMTGGNPSATSNWTGTLPAGVPTNAVVTWSVFAADVSYTLNMGGTSYQDNQLSGVTASAVVSPTVVCAGSTATLSALVPGLATSNGTLVTSGSGTSGGNNVSPYSHYYGGNRFQYMLTAAELTGLGLSAGNLTSLAFDVTTAGTTYNGFAINVTQTALTNLSAGFVTTGLTPVYGANVTPTVGINTYTFSTPYYWDGTSNVVFQVCWSNNNTGGTAAEVRYSNTSFVSEYYARGDNATPATACGGTGATGSNSARPKMIIGGNKAAGFTYAWSDGATTVGTTNPLVVNPTANTTYSATLTNGGGCSITSSPVTLNVTALPSAPTVANSSQCGVGVPTASVSGGTNYNWYATPTSTTVLQSGTATNYTTSIAATTTLYVTSINGTCESPRAAITTTVSIPDGVTAGTSSSNLCVGGANTITLTATQTGTTNPYSFTWNASPVTGSGMPTTVSGATVTVAPSLVGTYSYSVTATDGICTTVSSVTVAVNDLPSITASASPTAVCSGSNVNLNATTPAIGAGMVTLGTGTLTTTNTQELTAFCNRRINYRMQTVYTAAELSAAGLYAGNITAISYSIIANGSSNSNTNFAVKCGTTTATSFTDFISNAGFTTVLPATSYTHAVGVNTITFATPFNWDGTSNLVIEMTHDGIDDLYNAETYYTTTALNTVAYGYNTPASGTPSSSRFNITFSGQTIAQVAGGLTWQWNPGAINSNTTTVNPVNAGTVAATQVYTVTGTNPSTGCSNTATASVLVNPIPSTPVAADATQCGAGVPTASVSGGTSYFWYATPTSTTVLQSGAGSTYTGSINTTTTWYVSSSNGSCMSPRAALTQSVVTAPALTVTTPTSVVCANAIQTLSVTSVVADYDNYIWSPNTNLYTDASATTPYTGGSASVLYFSSAASSSYPYVINANNTTSGCVNSTSVTINTDQPVIASASATPTLLCAGATVSLTANTTVVASGTVAIGTGTLQTSGSNVSGGTYISPYSHYFGGYKSQYIIRASELQSAGLTAGNITALSLNVISAGTTYTDFAISMAATTQSVAGTTFDGTVSQVYGPVNATPVVGTNTYAFTTPFNWNGTSNIVIQICWSNNNTGGNGSAEVVYSATSYASTSYYRADSQTSSAMCGQTSATGTINNRPNIVLAGQKNTTGAGSVTWEWNPGAINGNTTTVTAVNTGTTATTETYTITALDPATTCTNAATVSFTVNPIPAVMASASSTSVCAGSSATLTASGATNYTWTAGGNASTQTVTPGALTVYTVTGATSGCSNTATVSVDVTPNPTVMATASSTLVCSNFGESSVLTASTTATTYSWSNGDATMSTTVTPTSGTTYTVTVTEAGCSASATIFVDAQICMAVNNLSAPDNSISIYPNPTNGIVNISISSELSGTTSVEIFDALGKLVISEKLSKDVTTINTSKLEDGMYMYKIINGNKAIKVGRMIKQ